jgi:hypothetical protein|uniref:Uncharacterized protein n=1 Tax=Oryza sativa subsp. japonica TaxID=39947 RepID=Q7EYH0_ORYSJ|nr:hypothetical protein [Oryza sativa Japonica Group]BAC99765.1 hypothetical protein [Oryza sativa Japonica Group]
METKFKDNKLKGMFNGRKSKQAQEGIESSSADLESGEDNDKGKNIFGVCFMAHGESDS